MCYKVVHYVIKFVFQSEGVKVVGGTQMIELLCSQCTTVCI